jgi:hypothetical protein
MADFVLTAQVGLSSGGERSVPREERTGLLIRLLPEAPYC